MRNVTESLYVAPRKFLLVFHKSRHAWKLTDLPASPWWLHPHLTFRDLAVDHTSHHGAPGDHNRYSEPANRRIRACKGDAHRAAQQRIGQGVGSRAHLRMMQLTDGDK